MLTVEFDILQTRETTKLSAQQNSMIL